MIASASLREGGGALYEYYYDLIHLMSAYLPFPYVARASLDVSVNTSSHTSSKTRLTRAEILVN